MQKGEMTGTFSNTKCESLDPKPAVLLPPLPCSTPGDGMQQPGTCMYVCICVHVCMYLQAVSMHSVRAGYGTATHHCQLGGFVPGQPWAC